MSYSKLKPSAEFILNQRYARKKADGMKETWEDIIDRIVAAVHPVAGDAPVKKRTKNMLLNQFFIPNSPCFTGAGTPLGQLAACFVLPISDDLGHNSDGIFATMKDATLVQQTGGGTGFDWSDLRPEGSIISSSGSGSTGPLSFMRAYNSAFGAIAQGGIRRGANMATLRVDHPDILKFIDCKKGTESELTYFNISVQLTDEFMQSVLRGGREQMKFKIQPTWNYRLEVPKITTGELFRKICENAWSNGEPGVLFPDTANAENPVPKLYTLKATNPCVTGDTIVSTDKGPFRVDELLNQPFNAIVGGKSYRCATGFFKTGTKPVHRLRTKSGFTVRLTNDHRVLCSHPGSDLLEYIQAGDLSKGDRLVVSDIKEFESRALASGISLAKVNGMDCAYDEYFSMSSCGTEDVYDCTVDDIHAFSANGLVVHNCGEQWLGPYENCCLGHVNLAKIIIEPCSDWRASAIARDSFWWRRHINWFGLADTVNDAVVFLNGIIDANKYIPSAPQFEERAKLTRRIGLGITALADVFMLLGITYGSAESFALAEDLMEFIRYHAMRSSAALASVDGAFPAFKDSIWAHPRDTQFYKELKPNIVSLADWQSLADTIEKVGLRNCCVLTVAPTGTTSIILGTEGSGCEPLFALSYNRNVLGVDGKQTRISYVCELLENALKSTYGDKTDWVEKVLQYVNANGELPPSSDANGAKISSMIRSVFGATANNVSPSGHLQMQASLQKWTDNSISKTINCPPSTTIEDIEKIYLDAWKNKLKGITVYRSHSREKEVLVAPIIAPTGAQIVAPEIVAPVEIPMGSPIPAALEPKIVIRRPDVLTGKSYRQRTVLGTVHVAINSDDNGHASEIFVTAGKSGSHIMFDCEAVGRLASLVLRMPTDATPDERLAMIGDQLSGIGGVPKSLGTWSSIPDAVARAIIKHTSVGNCLNVPAPNTKAETKDLSGYNRDYCSQCHSGVLIFQEHCRHCSVCDYNACS